MAKRSLTDFRPKGIDIDRRFYSDDDINRIVTAAGGLPDGDIKHKRATENGETFKVAITTVLVPRREALRERLKSAARVWHVDTQYQTEPTLTQRRRAFEDIESAVERLIETLGLPEKPTSNPLTLLPHALRAEFLQSRVTMENRTDETRLSNAIIGVYRLGVWASAAKSRLGPKSQTPRSQRNVGDEALDSLLDSLTNIWRDVFEKTVGMCVDADTGEATGPFLRFLQECLDPLLRDKTPSKDAIRARIRRLLVKSSPKKC